MVDDATRLDRAIDVLMAVARRDLDPSAGSVDLGELAAEIDGVDVVVRGTPPRAEGEPEVVRRALAPSSTTRAATRASASFSRCRAAAAACASRSATTARVSSPRSPTGRSSPERAARTTRGAGPGSACRSPAVWPALAAGT